MRGGSGPKHERCHPPELPRDTPIKPIVAYSIAYIDGHLSSFMLYPMTLSGEIVSFATIDPTHTTISIILTILTI